MKYFVNYLSLGKIYPIVEWGARGIPCILEPTSRKRIVLADTISPNYVILTDVEVGPSD